MGTSKEYMDLLLETISYEGEIRYKKMFGEYMIYVNDKPLLMVCDDIVYVKEKEELKDLMKLANKGYPYDGAKSHYILDVEDGELTNKVLEVLEKITEIPKKRRIRK